MSSLIINVALVTVVVADWFTILTFERERACSSPGKGTNVESVSCSCAPALRSSALAKNSIDMLNEDCSQNRKQGPCF